MLIAKLRPTRMKGLLSLFTSGAPDLVRPVAGCAEVRMHKQDHQKKSDTAGRRAYEPMLHMIVLPIASLLLLCAVIYGLLTLVGAFGAQTDILIVSHGGTPE